MAFLRTRRIQQKPRTVDRICRMIIKSREGVTMVNFSGVTMTPAHVKKVTHILQFTTVSAHATSIDLSAATLPQVDSLEEILNIISESCTRVKTVNLSRLTFTSQPSNNTRLSHAFAAFIRSNKVVVDLRLSNNNLGDAGIGVVAAAVTDNFKLQTLDLGQNSVKDNEDALILVASLLSRNAPGGDVSVRLPSAPYRSEESLRLPLEYNPDAVSPSLEFEHVVSSSSDNDDDDNDDEQSVTLPAMSFPLESTNFTPSLVPPNHPPPPIAPPSAFAFMAPPPALAPTAAPPPAYTVMAPPPPPPPPTPPLPTPLAPPSYNLHFGTTPSHDSASTQWSTPAFPPPPTQVPGYGFVSTREKGTPVTTTVQWGHSNDHPHVAAGRNNQNNIYSM